jgi:hypothetical protein
MFLHNYQHSINLICVGNIYLDTVLSHNQKNKQISHSEKFDLDN